MTEKKNKCPHCNKPANWENNPFKPFCSERCKLIDLGNWASEKYRVPHQEIDPQDIPEDQPENLEDN